MKTLMKIIIFLSLILITGLLSCDDSNPLVKPTIFTIDNFPHEIGTVWQYQRVNRINMSTDTLFVRIADSTIITNDSILVYVVISDLNTYSEKSSDTTFWHISGDTVTYYTHESDSLYQVTKNVVFPLDIGAFWSSGTFPPDSNEVMQITSQTILGKRYNSAYQIIRTASAFNEYYTENYWYVPNIGLIQSTINYILWTNTIDETWSLISFNEPDSLTLADFPLQVGASWKYKVYNNLIDCATFTDCFDTCTVTILDSVVMDDGMILENWLFDYPTQEQIIRESRFDNRLLIQWYHTPLFFTLHFPLKVGQIINQGPGRSSGYKVIDRQTITTAAGTFKDAYYIKGSSGDWYTGAGSDFEMWIAKGVGIVKLQHQSYTNDDEEDKTWELQSYSPNNPAPQFTIDKFPNYDGMTRTYEIDKGPLQSLDTVYAHVTESSTVAIWNYTMGDSSWQELISVEENAVTFVSSGRIQVSYKSFQFPITIGNKWVTFPFENETEVVFATTVETSAGRFFPSYALRTVYNCDDCTHEEIDYIYPSIGIVYKRIYIPHLGINETWKLIDYSNP